MDLESLLGFDSCCFFYGPFLWGRSGVFIINFAYYKVSFFPCMEFLGFQRQYMVFFPPRVHLTPELHMLFNLGLHGSPGILWCLFVVCGVTFHTLFWHMAFVAKKNFRHVIFYWPLEFFFGTDPIGSSG